MELVYLWVEEYKNIKRQGFNFSPRFKCEFKAEYTTYKNKKDEEKKCPKDNGELLIIDKEEIEEVYLKNFFDHNISINGVIGKNGSGKTSLITLISGGIFDNDDLARGSSGLIYVYKVKNGFKVFSFCEAKKNYQIPIISNKHNIEYLPLLIQDENKKVTFEKSFKENYHLVMDFSIGQIDLYNTKIKKDYKKYFSVEPSRNYRTNGPSYRGQLEPTAFDANMRSNILYLYKYLNEEQREVLNLPVFNQMVYYGRRRMSPAIREDYVQIIKKSQSILGIDFSGDLDYEKIIQKIEEYFEKRNWCIPFESIDKRELENIQILSMFASLGYENKDDELVFWTLSTGQRQLISYFGIIIRTIEEYIKTEEQTLTIIIDEIETSLHPQWQKEFFKLLMKLIAIVTNKCKNIQILLVGHSPFIVSDLPKENIIFLKDGQQVNGIEKKETFGANIHTLLADSFFVEGGLIGSFAKDKIDEVIEKLNNQGSMNDEDIQYCENIINIIGEPIIKRELQRKLDSRRLSEVDNIRKQILELEKRLEEQERKSYD